ncbi:MAG: thiamine pyrophosphate-binding protein [Chloroflexi bacterium]|nr:thiamine pyrophosphate-binding protein [Chloroflexota bacterium]
MPVMTGGEALAASLAAEGTDVVFGLPGVHIMEALDAIYRQQRIRWITVRHEQTAAYMAYGYARTTGRVGVAMVVPGPGALNAAAAIGTAYAGSAPVLLVSGQVESHHLGKKRGALHEVEDQLDVFRPITKWGRRVLAAPEIPGAVHEAMHHLRTGRPRPVEMEIPKDVMEAKAEVGLLEPDGPAPAAPDPAAMRAAASALAAARYPVIWAGGGVISSNAGEDLTRLAERLAAPVITTPEGKGSIREDHPLSLGAAFHGFGPARRTLRRADMILAVGSRFNLGPTSGLSSDQKLVRIDADADEIRRGPAAHTAIVADARAALRSLLELLPGGTGSNWTPSVIREIRKQVLAELEQMAPVQLSILRTLRQELEEDAIVVSGTNNVAYWAHLAFPVLRPRAYLTSSYFATLGYAFPAALGAKTGNPRSQVVALCGDGGFMYALPELATAVPEQLNVVVLVFADGYFGSCLHHQQRGYNGRAIGTRLHNPDFARVAEDFGARGIKLSGPDELGPALRSVRDATRPTVIEIPLPHMPTPF